MKKPLGLLIATSFILVSHIYTGKQVSANTLKPVVDKSAAINESAVKSQKKIDRLAEQIDNKLQQFKSVNKEFEGLQVYNQQMEKQIENQLLEMQRLNDSIDTVSVIERQITPLMLRMIKGLEDFVALDVPFLTEEREKRIQSLKEMMTRADVAVSEKFRRILEAYQVEVDYGRTIEAYTGMADIDGNEQEVNFLRVGRVSLVYQTRDRQLMGVWNKKNQQWEPLDKEYRTQTIKGLRMAQKQLAPDMIIVPVSAAE
ncbi:DUF3450 domain-containing protein [Aliikangiella coralliicola]|uniref:DUF3450 domain-containing protein n=1 Tax=Aliikangiella coralliicola TaxID=2592383 RepID=A0A545UFY4_9GAMM|nr:DUF3450 domain-containing protein [Aliikangiella coralliicola]TQV88378.1 DUF3450 domain-containing protein [Aliikangiella coralliicola]